MPELPDITVYIEALEPRVIGQRLERMQLNSPFLLRTATPPISSINGREVDALRRLGKRICFGFEDQLWLVLHLMIAGRLHWKNEIGAGLIPAAPRAATRAAPTRFPKNQLAVFQFDNGSLSLTEAGTQRRASMYLLQGEQSLRKLDRGGVELFQKPDRQSELVNSGLGKFIEMETFASVLQSENHTLKRALTDPRLFSGIGNAYSDEILWNAHLSPVKLTQKLADEELQRLYDATRATLVDWVERLRAEADGEFPEKVTAFRKGMATHGRYKEPLPALRQ